MARVCGWSHGRACHSSNGVHACPALLFHAHCMHSTMIVAYVQCAWLPVYSWYTISLVWALNLLLKLSNLSHTMA